MNNIPEIFGSMVFNDSVMKERLPENIYKALKTTMERGTHLQIDVANTVAEAMKEWACEKGATHFTHWFQPMTGVTAEKHDSFITPDGKGGVIMHFSGKELVKGEPDASSFPSGGLRATFEARGYTAWDPSSYAFIKDDTLYIPTAFCSYGGEVLDKKTPLLRSMEVLSNQAIRILRLFGDTNTKKVINTVGPEQEYFLVDKSYFDKRRDLKFCGRTLFGVHPPKMQELDDHYFGSIKPRVAAFMKDLDYELWKLGVLAKTEHNEAAPAQHELAPIFTTGNIAADHNQITMEMMKKVALRHGLVCLLHEKPFDGVNGSGKHNNWALSTDSGINLLEPGNDPENNVRFLLLLVAVMKAVDKYAELLRMSVATPGNDHRLGAAEAPPAIVSIFLGDELTAIFDAIEKDKVYNKHERVLMEIGASVLPHFPKDTTDRNRTSPFAFTGNKFEFRMLGASSSISGPNIVLNTAVADVLGEFADVLENAEDFDKALHDLIRDTIKNHRRIVFDGNNYSKEWVEEASRRGLPNISSAAEAIKWYKSKKSVDLFTKHNIFTETELISRCEIHQDHYCKIIHIEALTMIEMVRHEILPSAMKYSSVLAESAYKKNKIGVQAEFEMDLCRNISAYLVKINGLTDKLEKTLDGVKANDNAEKASEYCNNRVMVEMKQLREAVDALEPLMDKEYMPYPDYGTLMFGV